MLTPDQDRAASIIFISIGLIPVLSFRAVFKISALSMELTAMFALRLPMRQHRTAICFFSQRLQRGSILPFTLTIARVKLEGVNQKSESWISNQSHSKPTYRKVQAPKHMTEAGVTIIV